MTPSHLKETIYERNLKKYGDEYGPTINWYISEGYKWEEIIYKSTKVGGSDINFNNVKK